MSNWGSKMRNMYFKYSFKTAAFILTPVLIGALAGCGASFQTALDGGQTTTAAEETTIAISEETLEEITTTAPEITTEEETIPTSGKIGDNLNWTFDEKTGLLEISGTGYMNPDSSDGMFPWFKYSFNDDIESVNISEGITSVGYCAFSGCSSLKSIDIPANVTEIAGAAFSNCSSLKSIYIPANVTYIDYYAFSGCSGLESIIVDDNNSVYDSRDNCNAIIVTESNELLAGCKNTQIPLSVISIGTSAFNHNSSLKSIDIPANVASIGDYAFAGCCGLEDITVNADNPIYDSRDNCNAIILTGTNELICSCKNTVIPSSVTAIGSYAYYGRSYLEDFEVPSNITIIGDGAFGECTNLVSIKIPSTVTSIGQQAFSGCSSLVSIDMSESITEISNNTFMNCSSLSNFEIPNSVCFIDSSAFFGCSSLKSIEIPAGVCSIGNYVFTDCKSLESITVDENNRFYDSRNNCNAIISTKTDELICGCNNTKIPSNVKSIGAGAFEGCEGIVSIIIPSEVSSIGNFAFMGCINLESIELPKSVKEIDMHAISNCEKLSSVYYEGTEADKNNISAYMGRKLSEEFTNESLSNATWYYEQSMP